MRSTLQAILLLALTAWSAAAVELHVNNPHGDVTIRVAVVDELQMRTSSPERILNQSDISVDRNLKGITVNVQPADRAQIDLDFEVPIGVAIEANVDDGAFRFSGMPAALVVSTGSGPVEIEAPWDATRLLLFGLEKPKQLETPDGFGFKQRKGSDFPGANWVLEDKLDEDRVTYGSIRVRADRAESVVLKHTPIPPDSPVKMHWQAQAVADRILSERPQATARRPAPKTAAAPPGASTLAEPGEALFTSNVRLVNLTAAVFAKDGRPLTSLGAKDFVVRENGVEQEVSSAGAEDAPFNLAILFDFSGSTTGAREKMKRIAEIFTRIARPQDRLAFYILARNQFIEMSKLTTNHDAVRKQIDAVPQLSGGSPVYDSIVLAYDHELAKRPNERNALLVISDGKDNRIELVGAPSKVSYRELEDVAKRMNALLYPIFLGPDPSTMSKRSNNHEAYARFEDFARAAGGRAFAAATIEDFERVTKEVAEELRSVYSVAYYPKDQDFNGAWRQVEIEPKTSGARIRHRDGYYAQ